MFILLRPQITMSGAKKIISGTEIIILHSNHMASLPDLIVCEAEIIMFKPEMTASKLEIIISTTTKTASVSGLDRYDGKQYRYGNAVGYRRLNNNHVEARDNRLEFTVNLLKAEVNRVRCRDNYFQDGVDYW